VNTCLGTNPSPDWEGVFPPWEPSRSGQSPRSPSPAIPGPRTPSSLLDLLNPNCLSCH
jgi:hypothetical protein